MRPVSSDFTKRNVLWDRSHHCLQLVAVTSGMCVVKIMIAADMLRRHFHEWNEATSYVAMPRDNKCEVQTLASFAFRLRMWLKLPTASILTMWIQRNHVAYSRPCHDFRVACLLVYFSSTPSLVMSIRRKQRRWCCSWIRGNQWTSRATVTWRYEYGDDNSTGRTRKIPSLVVIRENHAGTIAWLQA